MKLGLPSSIVAAFLLAGCVTGAEPGSRIDVQYDDQSTIVIEDGEGGHVAVNVTNATGTVVGRVLSDAGFEIRGARVNILGAKEIALTNMTGWFRMTDIPPGKRPMRVSHDEYKPVESEILIEPGVAKRVTIRMVPLGVGGYAPHVHDFWGGKDSYTVFKEVIEFEEALTEVPKCGDFYYADVVTHGAGLTHEECYHFPFVPEPGVIVPPGTRSLTIDLDIDPGPLFDEETWSLVVGAPGYFNSTGKYESAGWWTRVVESADEATFEYDEGPLMPLLVDDGHATRTEWLFYLYFSPATTRVASTAAAYFDTFVNPFEVTITAQRGEVVMDAPHPRFWKDTDRVPMSASVPGNANCDTSNPVRPVHLSGICSRSPEPSLYFPAQHQDQGDWTKRLCLKGCMVLDAGRLVPPGTTRIEFDLEQWWGNASFFTSTEALRTAFKPDAFSLGYKTANTPAGHATWEDYTWIEPVGTYTPEPLPGRHWSEGKQYVIEDVRPDETDTFYERLSNWVFMMAVEGHEEAGDWSDMQCSYYACGITYFQLKNFIVINEDRDEMLADGRA